VTNVGSSNISGYSISSTTGALTAVNGSPFAVQANGGANLSAVAIDPTGKVALVGNPDAPISPTLHSQTDNLLVYSIDPTSGALQPAAGSPYTTGGESPAAVSFDSAGRFVYVLNEIYQEGAEGTAVTAYSLDSAHSALQPVSGSPFRGANRTGGPHFLTLDPSGKFLYVSCNGCGIQTIGFVLDPTTGGSTAIDPTALTIQGKISAQSFVSVSSGVYAISLNAANVCANKLDATTGVLKQVSCLALPSGSVTSGGAENGLAVDPLGKFVYVTNPALNSASVFVIDPATGTLTSPNGSPFAGGMGPTAVAADAKGAVIYVTNSGSNDVSAYVVNRTSGVLTAITGSPFVAGSTPGAISLH
jgi:DNA-binding beta-propeller fold protein YncE